MNKPTRNSPRRFALATLAAFAASTLGACAVSPTKVTVPAVPALDLPRFMGPWHVIGVIPTFLEKDIHNAVESYALAPDGSIRTTFTFNQGAPDGPAKRYQPTGFVVPGTNNAVWGMQFVWPVKAEFVVSHVDEAYSETIIARSARDYVWIMARSPQLSEARYQALVKKVGDLGYDTGKLVRIPHAAPAR